MTVSEVNLEVDPAIAPSYREWLEEHIREMLTLPGFTSAEMLEQADDGSDDRVRLIVAYRLESEAALERYFSEFAERMRADGLARFAGRFTARRRVLRHRAAFGRT